METCRAGGQGVESDQPIGSPLLRSGRTAPVRRRPRRFGRRAGGAEPRSSPAFPPTSPAPRPRRPAPRPRTTAVGWRRSSDAGARTSRVTQVPWRRADRGRTRLREPAGTPSAGGGGRHVLASRTPPVYSYVRPSADLLFSSLAEAWDGRHRRGAHAGRARDGADGVLAIKRHGGTVIVQDEASSEFFGMPDAAVRTGTCWTRCCHLDAHRGGTDEIDGRRELERRRETRERGKRGGDRSRRRRLRQAARLPQDHPRLRLLGLQALQPDPPGAEADAAGRRRAPTPTTSTTSRSTPTSSPPLFNTILINVTAFFRDPAAWEALRRARSCRASCEDKRPDEPIRLLERRLRLGRGGLHAWPCCSPRRWASERVPRAGEDLRHRRRRGGAGPGAAGRATPPSRSQAIPAELLEKLLRAGRTDRYVFRQDLRRSVIFGRHDLIQDAADLADRPAGLPQHPDVLQRRDAGQDPRPLPLRPRTAAASSSWARPRPCSATPTASGRST